LTKFVKIIFKKNIALTQTAPALVSFAFHSAKSHVPYNHQSDKDHQNQHKAALQDADEIFAIYFYISFYHNDLDHGTTMIFFIANQS
jgi:hypothetical protein